jgi:hypothetical protein
LTSLHGGPKAPPSRAAAITRRNGRRGATPAAIAKETGIDCGVVQRATSRLASSGCAGRRGALSRPAMKWQLRQGKRHDQRVSALAGAAACRHLVHPQDAAAGGGWSVTCVLATRLTPPETVERLSVVPPGRVGGEPARSPPTRG